MTQLTQQYANHIKQNARILIVDDVAINLSFLEATLQGMGIKHIVPAGNGRNALKRLQEQRFDLVITDVAMPEIDGIELCKLIRQENSYGDIPIIVQTGVDKDSTRNTAFDAGATDFISKPIDIKELTSRVKIHIENKWLVDELQDYKDYMQAELKHAHFMQKMLLPSAQHLHTITQKTELALLNHHHPPLLLGGDLWSANLVSDNEISICMLDVSGHGISAALNAFRTHTLIEEGKEHLGTDPGAFTTRLNARLHHLFNVDQFATFFYGVIDVKKHELRYSVAAHTQALVYRGKTNSIDALEQSGFPLSIKADATYETFCTSFTDQDYLFLYSDALIETEDANGQSFDEEGLLAYLNTKLVQEKKSAPEFFSQLIKDFYDQYAATLKDDLSIVMVYSK